MLAFASIEVKVKHVCESSGNAKELRRLMKKKSIDFNGITMVRNFPLNIVNTVI